MGPEYLTPKDFELRTIQPGAIFSTDDTMPAVVNPTSRNTDLLTPFSRSLLEKLTVSQLVKKFPAFYGTRRSITAFTVARHLSLY